MPPRNKTKPSGGKSSSSAARPSRPTRSPRGGRRDDAPPPPPKSKRQLLSAAEVGAELERLAAEIFRDFPSAAGLMILGIRTRGAIIAERLRDILSEKYGTPVGLGTLDITLYRDDLSALGPQPDVRDSELPFAATGANIILVDDVLYTGRTIRAALDEIIDYGRPSLIRLLVLVDRGLHEYPIRADYCGLAVETAPDESVQVRLSELEDEDCAVLLAGASKRAS